MQANGFQRTEGFWVFIVVFIRLLLSEKYMPKIQTVERPDLQGILEGNHYERCKTKQNRL
jgi:hypothetical protein